MDGLLIGRFQPFHLGHLAAVRFALSRSGRLWLGIGSSDGPQDASNPFTAAEREEMALSSLGPAEAGRALAFRIPDIGDHRAWAASLGRIVPPYGAVFTNDPMTARACSGGGAEVVPIPFERRAELSGTAVRARIAAGLPWEHLVPEGSARALRRIGAAARLAAFK